MCVRGPACWQIDVEQADVVFKGTGTMETGGTFSLCGAGGVDNGKAMTLAGEGLHGAGGAEVREEGIFLMFFILCSISPLYTSLLVFHFLSL